VISMGLDMKVPFDVTWSCYWDREVHWARASPAASAGMRSPRWASRTRSRTRHDAGLAQNLRRAAGFPGRLYSTQVRSVPAIRFLEEGSHNVKMKPLISREDGARKTAMHELIIGKG